jgi:protein-L-isoaspartate O-methyltransferase
LVLGQLFYPYCQKSLGAKEVDAVEIDKNANQNANQNLVTNNCKVIKIIDGDGDSIPNKKYDYLLVNINRNTIIQEFTNFLRGDEEKLNRPFFRIFRI